MTQGRKWLTPPAARAVLAIAFAAASAGCTSSERHRSPTIEVALFKVPATAYVSVTQVYLIPQKPLANGPIRYAVTDHATIVRLAGLINALPQARSQLITPCPSSEAPAFELDFKDSASASPAVQVWIECYGVDVALHGTNGLIRSYLDPDTVASLLAPSLKQSGADTQP